MADIASDMPMSAARPLRFRSFSPLGWPVYAWFIALVLVPNLLLIGASFLRTSNGLIVFDPSIASYVRLWKSSSFQFLLLKTLATSFGAATIGCLIAYPMAYYAARVVQKNRSVIVLLVIIPLWISLLMRVFAWRMILGQNGVLNSFLVGSGMLEQPSEAFLYTGFSVLLTYTYISIPFCFVAIFTALEKIPHSLIEASQDSGASSWQTFRHVVWPLSRPSVAIGFSLAFLMTVGDYITPSMVGGIDGTMIGMVIASQFGIANNWPYGSAIAVCLMLSVGIVLAFVMWAGQTKGVLMGDEGAKPSVSRARLGSGRRLLRSLAAVAFVLPFLFLYAPLAIMVLMSFNDSSVQAFPLHGATLRWYAELAENASMLEAVRRSLVVGFAVVLVSSVAATGFAFAIHYGRVRQARFFEFALAIPVAIPGVVLGIVMVLATQLVQVPSGIFRTVIGQSSFVMPVILMIILARLRRLDGALLEASMDAGANHWQSFVHVLFPSIRGAVIGGALLGFTLSADDVMVTLFLSGTAPTLPIWVWNQMRFGFTPSVNAIFTLVGVGSLLAILICNRLVFRGTSRAAGSS
ncbi:binding-protein-dependent transport systems inner membrane component [Ancylobacter novellus DSM 506]|uniref:Binding-protein-dependent transport systems inner membrane component n=1 Tax=Ancylobacter novellus (strain ATCC 8093 / DSM 506 / JCM 20403 / CCM 1077 / IAM 12100 / NBRC 12443 / NCIMB 10456) TaxID=639283 RepID=D7A079_ANCN5|nr:ABC transporter permease subunit [Ancylobacter novellus]ADH89340.1 binding-protein-dependent transport systems inner membrane component [Ancylobacter novellus DSM 506]